MAQSHRGAAGYLSILAKVPGAVPAPGHAGVDPEPGHARGDPVPGHALSSSDTLDFGFIDDTGGSEDTAFMLVNDDSPSFDFGVKHKGSSFRWVYEMDPGYYFWASRQSKPSARLAHFIKWVRTTSRSIRTSIR